MTRYSCDLCGEEIERPFRSKSYYVSADKPPGRMFVIVLHVDQGELCEACARSIAGGGKAYK